MLKSVMQFSSFILPSDMQDKQKLWYFPALIDDLVFQSSSAITRQVDQSILKPIDNAFNFHLHF